MRLSEVVKALDSADLARVYGGKVAENKERLAKLLAVAMEKYGDVEGYLFSSPGRVEVGGNHTDHQKGCVVAASVDLDIAAVVIPNGKNSVHYEGNGFVADVDLADLEVKEEEKNSTPALIRGVAKKCQEMGYTIGGVEIVADSILPHGSGISSSASFECLMGCIFSEVFNEGKISAIDIAKIGQYAENVYFGKPCGLLDQSAIALGSFVFIDFKDFSYESIPFDFSKYGYQLCLVATAKDHADLTDEYAAIPAEMKLAAKAMGAEVLSEKTLEDLYANAPAIREAYGDRAFLRAFHYYHETERAVAEAQALKKEDIKEVLRLIVESGNSSYKYLQNILVASDVANQELGAALALSEAMIKDKGAYRVHGGGFGGTMLAIVPTELFPTYKETIEKVLKLRVMAFNIRGCGTTRII
ncbi:MAG: galactokinase [Erysipelotrichaceae bacterium]|nr:galactokinase [Erysipelotrichaceae bacterium]